MPRAMPWETDRTRVRRKPERAAYDAESVYGIVDDALWCHVGALRNGSPVVIPMIHARVGDDIYLHGSPAAGILRDGHQTTEVCVTFTLVDGLALTRSARTHSMIYRSAVVYGLAHRLRDEERKLAALEAITNHIVPGRWAEVRRPTRAEVRETEVLTVTVTEASAKARVGPPTVDESGGESGAWAGVIPLITVRGEPERAAFVSADVPAPRW